LVAKRTALRQYVSGDGGNRTRVRKIRPSELYERSRMRLVIAGVSPGRNTLRPAAGLSRM